MRASDPVEDSSKGEVVPLDRNREPHHATPVYAHRAEEGTGTFEAEIDVRGWSVQALQWLIIFAVLGLLIGGAKWWSLHQDAAIARLVAAPPPITTPVRPAEGDGDGTAATLAPDVDSSGAASIDRQPVTYDPSAAPSAAPQMPDGSAVDPSASDDLAAAGAAAGTIDAPMVRAPADVPYPRRIHDVTPDVPEGAAARRGIAVLTLLIDTAGDVADVELLRSLDPVRDEAAIAAAWQWKFEPTLRNGQPVAVRSNFTVRFGY
jgi:protein TonB